MITSLQVGETYFDEYGNYRVIEVHPNKFPPLLIAEYISGVRAGATYRLSYPHKLEWLNSTMQQVFIERDKYLQSFFEALDEGDEIKASFYEEKYLDQEVIIRLYIRHHRNLIQRSVDTARLELKSLYKKHLKQLSTAMFYDLWNYFTKFNFNYNSNLYVKIAEILLYHSESPKDIRKKITALYFHILENQISASWSSIREAIINSDDSLITRIKAEIIDRIGTIIPTELAGYLKKFQDYIDVEINKITYNILATFLREQITNTSTLIVNRLVEDYSSDVSTLLQQLNILRTHLEQISMDNFTLALPNYYDETIRRQNIEWVESQKDMARQRWKTEQLRQLEDAIINQENDKMIETKKEALARVLFDIKRGNNSLSSALASTLLIQSRQEASQIAEKLEHERLHNIIPNLQKKIIRLSKRLRDRRQYVSKETLREYKNELIDARIEFCVALYQRTPDELDQLRIHFAKQVEHEIAYGEYTEDRGCWLCKSRVGPQICDECQSMGCHWWVCACGACKDPCHCREKNTPQCIEQELRFGALRMGYLIEQRLQECDYRQRHQTENSIGIWDEFPF